MSADMVGRVQDEVADGERRALLDVALRALGVEVPDHWAVAERIQALRRATAVVTSDVPPLRCLTCDEAVADALVDAGVKRCPFCETSFEDEEVPAGTSTKTTTSPAAPGEQPEEAGVEANKAAVAVRRPAGVVVVPPTAADVAQIGKWTPMQLEERTRKVETLLRNLGEKTYEAALELKEIRDKGIYSAMHDSFEKYVETECRVSPGWVTKLIRAVEAFEVDFKVIGEANAVRLLREPPAVQKKWVAALKKAPMTKRELDAAIVGKHGKRAAGQGVGGGRPKTRLMVEDLVGKPLALRFKKGVAEARLGSGYVAVVTVGKDGSGDLQFVKRG